MRTGGAWRWRAPSDLRVGRGVRGALATAPGRRWLVVCSARGRGQLEEDPVLAPVLAERDVTYLDGVTSNPDLAWMEAGATSLMHASPFDAVVGFGGGSALDAAKVVAARLAAPQNEPLEHLLRDPSTLSAARLPYVACLPTTAGTGSEVTPFATVWDHRSRRKHSLAHAALWPAMALVDADLMDGLPPDVTLATGLDALNQAFESIWNRNANPVTLELAMRSVVLAWAALPALLASREDGRPAADDGKSAPAPGDARGAMAEASVLAGLAIGGTRTAICHAMSYPITAHFGVPHGVACAFTMAAVARFVLPRDDGRLQDVARRVFGPHARATDVPTRLAGFLASVGVADRVRRSVPSFDDLEVLARDMLAPGRAENTLRSVTEPDVVALLAEAWSGGPSGPHEWADA